MAVVRTNSFDGQNYLVDFPTTLSDEWVLRFHRKIMYENWYHVIPNNDLIEHTFGDTCECQPILRPDDMLVVHNAMDNREFDEIADEIGDKYGTIL